MTPAHGVSGFFRRPQPIKPRAGQESVWDYPRPPRVEPRSERVIVRLGGQVIADTTDAVRVLETSHPPVYYLPFDAFPAGALIPDEGTTFCEFKGEAHYFDVVAGGVVVPRAGWTYPEPARGFEALSTRVALYPSHMDACEVNDEQVTSQEGTSTAVGSPRRSLVRSRVARARPGGERIALAPGRSHRSAGAGCQDAEPEHPAGFPCLPGQVETRLLSV